MPRRSTDNIAQRLEGIFHASRAGMRKDRGLNGSFDRLATLSWIMLLKLIDDTDSNLDGQQYNGANMQAMVGIAGDMRPQKRAACVLAGHDPGLVSSAVGIAGVMSPAVRAAVVQGIAGDSRLGDRAVRAGFERAVMFSAFNNDVTPYHPTGRGGYVAGDLRDLRWREGREELYGRTNRTLPYYLDSAAPMRCFGTAKRQLKWIQSVQVYLAAIALTDPNGYAGFDDPGDRAATMAAHHEIVATFPDDAQPRPTRRSYWPTPSCRWTYDASARIDPAALAPIFRGRELRTLIPFNEAQFRPKDSYLDRIAYQAVANAQAFARDPDVRAMVQQSGRLMVGGMVQGPIHRLVRHLYAAQLVHEFGDMPIWLLGQANWATVNGLGIAGLLDRVWTDGAWWISDSLCEVFPYVKDGLITMVSLGPKKRGKASEGGMSFFSTVEKMAANMRALMAAYSGLWAWPTTPAPPIDVRDHEQLAELKRQYQQAQMDLGLGA